MLHAEGTIGNIAALTETPEFAEFMADVTRNEAAITPEELDEMEHQARADNIRLTVVALGWQSEVRYPGCEDWAYVGTYHTEDLAIERATDQIATWQAMQELPRLSPEQHRQEILATLQAFRGEVRAEIQRVKRTA